EPERAKQVLDRVEEVGAPEARARGVEGVVGDREVVSPFQPAVRPGQIDRPNVPDPWQRVPGVDQVPEEPETGGRHHSGKEDAERLPADTVWDEENNPHSHRGGCA